MYNPVHWHTQTSLKSKANFYLLLTIGFVSIILNLLLEVSFEEQPIVVPSVLIIGGTLVGTFFWKSRQYTQKVKEYTAKKGEDINKTEPSHIRRFFVAALVERTLQTILLMIMLSSSAAVLNVIMVERKPITDYFESITPYATLIVFIFWLRSVLIAKKREKIFLTNNWADVETDTTKN